MDNNIIVALISVGIPIIYDMIKIKVKPKKGKKK